VERAEWIRAFQGMVGVALHEGEIALILELVTTVESAADPLAAAATCLLAGRASLSLSEGLRLAEVIAAWDDSWG
jgi:hypothetical protein